MEHKRHEKFIARWRKVKQGGLKRHVLATAIGWTFIMGPIFKIIQWYTINRPLISWPDILLELLLYVLSGVSYAIILWIINNYLYAKYTGEWTSEEHTHD